MSLPKFPFARALIFGAFIYSLIACNSAQHSGTSASSSSTSASLSPSSLSTDVTVGNFQLMATAYALPQDPSALALGISQIDLRVQGGTDYVNVSTSALTVTPSTIEGGVLFELADTTIAAGTYDQVRITFSSMAATLPNGDSVSVNFADNGSAAQLASAGSSSSGFAPLPPPERNVMIVPIRTPIVVTADAVTHGVLDLASLPRRGGRDASLLPMLQYSNLDTAGSVSGIVSSSSATLPGALVIVSKRGRFVGSAIADTTGTYTIVGLAADTYTISTFLKDYVLDVEQLSVIASTEASLNITLTAK